MDYLIFKGETIQWVNARLTDRKAGIDDDTIGVIMCLATWEVSFHFQELPSGSVRYTDSRLDRSRQSSRTSLPYGWFAKDCFFERRLQYACRKAWI
jgi:hypothetical protein